MVQEPENGNKELIIYINFLVSKRIIPGLFIAGVVVAGVAFNTEFPIPPEVGFAMMLPEIVMQLRGK